MSYEHFKIMMEVKDCSDQLKLLCDSFFSPYTAFAFAICKMQTKKRFRCRVETKTFHIYFCDLQYEIWVLSMNGVFKLDNSHSWPVRTLSSFHPIPFTSKCGLFILCHLLHEYKYKEQPIIYSVVFTRKKNPKPLKNL